MVNGDGRVELLRAVAANLPEVADADLELMGRFNIRSRAMAEQILWQSRQSLLGAFHQLVAALEADVDEETPMPPATDLTPPGRFNRLLEWRSSQSDPSVARLSDQDLGRLAASSATHADDIRSIAPQFSAGHVVVAHAAQLAAVLTGNTPPAEPVVETARAVPAPEPAVVPDPEPQPIPQQADDPSAIVDFQWQPVTRFAPRDMLAGEPKPFGFVAAHDDDHGVMMEWTPAPEAAVTLYRVLSSPTTWPSGSPELGSLVGVTRETRGTLQLWPSGPVTYLAVWVNQGDSMLSATMSQPRLVGVTEIVWPPTGLGLKATPNHTVAGLLRAPEGSKVEVQRFLKGMPVSYDINRELDDPTLISAHGFQDFNPPMGRDVIYAAFCVAQLSNGQPRTSRPATAEIHLKPDPEQVAVQVAAREDGTYDLTWQAPSHGDVRLYALPSPPDVGLDREPLSAEVIEIGGVHPEERIHQPPQSLGGSLMTIRGFVADPSWARVHFVAAHWISEEVVWLGPTVSKVTPRPPSHVEVVERVDAQIITFAWPKDVTVVQAFHGPRGQGVDPAGAEPVAQLTREEYVQMGGMRITKTLPSRGCSIHLHGVIYLQGQPVHSEPATVDYSGITRLRYQVKPQSAPGSTTGGAVSYRIEGQVDADLHDTPLIIVGRPDRLPLHPQDGTVVAQPAPVSMVAGHPVQLAEVRAGSRPVYLRMFIHRPPAECGSVAVLDPSVSTLQVHL